MYTVYNSQMLKLWEETNNIHASKIENIDSMPSPNTGQLSLNFPTVKTAKAPVEIKSYDLRNERDVSPTINMQSFGFIKQFYSCLGNNRW